MRKSSTRSNHVRWLPGLVAVLLTCRPPAPQEDPYPQDWTLLAETESVEAPSGMVVSRHPLASAVGAEILEQGGNAIDAAVAVGFALAVVLPEAGNIGGGGFLVFRDAEGEVASLDYRETAPLLATRDMFLDQEGRPTRDSVVGHRAVGVPGSVAGLWEMHRRLGSLDWEDLVTPAVELARGHEITETRHRNLQRSKEHLARFDATARQFLVDGEALPAGSWWSQPELAATLGRIAAGGVDEFYRGPTAELLVAEMERGGGLITREDLMAYRPVWRDPVRIEYRDHVIWSMPPSSSGGVALAIIFNLLEGFAPLPPALSGDLIQLEVEAMRWAFLDRNHFLGDPEFVDMPLERLLSKEYAAELRARVRPGRAGSTPVSATPFREGSSTTHYSIVDAWGNAASVTTTLNLTYGSGVTVEGAGFLLNNEMDDFTVLPGEPNQFGLVQGEANAIAPGKRMLSSMSPSVVEDGAGDLLLVIGSPGGSTIITSVYRVISNVLDHGMTLAEAVAAPRLHHQALPDRVFYEPAGLSETTLQELQEMGYELEERSRWIGNVNAVLRKDHGWVGVADPRRGGGAAGVYEVAPPLPQAVNE